MSQGDKSQQGPAGTDYCAKRSTTTALIQNLKNSGIPSFFPTGNDFDSKRINWPACIADSIAIGSVTKANQYVNQVQLNTNLILRESVDRAQV